MVLDLNAEDTDSSSIIFWSLKKYIAQAIEAIFKAYL